MSPGKRTITFTETSNVLVIRLRPQDGSDGWCPKCSAQVIWLEVTAEIRDAVGRLAETENVHLRDDGRVCSRSLIPPTPQ